MPLPRNNENVFNNRVKCKSEREKVIWVINNHIPNTSSQAPQVGPRPSSWDYTPTSWYVPLSLFSTAELTRNSPTELKELITMLDTISGLEYPLIYIILVNLQPLKLPSKQTFSHMATYINWSLLNMKQLQNYMCNASTTAVMDGRLRGLPSQHHCISFQYWSSIQLYLSRMGLDPWWTLIGTLASWRM